MVIKEIDIKKELDSNQNILLLVPGADYNDQIISIAKELGGASICYVSLNKTYKALQDAFKKNEIDVENIIFIDCISKTIVKETPQEKNCYYVSSPGALTEVSIVIGKFLKHNFSYIIFDSLNSLLVYQKKSPISKFLSDLVNKVKATKTKAIFYALSSEEQSKLIDDAAMFVDKVIDLSDGSSKDVSKPVDKPVNLPEKKVDKSNKNEGDKQDGNESG